jgi:hypothetical protein
MILGRHPQRSPGCRRWVHDRAQTIYRRPWSGAVARAALPRTTMPAQPGGHRYDRGTTATLMAGVNPAAAPARHSHSSLALAVSAAAGVRSVPTNNDRTENRAAVTPDGQPGQFPARKTRWLLPHPGPAHGCLRVTSRTSGMPLGLTARRASLPQYFSQLGDLARPAGFEPATRCLEGRYAQRVSLPVRRSTGIPSCPGSDRKFPVLTGRSGTQGHGGLFVRNLAAPVGVCSVSLNFYDSSIAVP